HCPASSCNSPRQSHPTSGTSGCWRQGRRRQRCGGYAMRMRQSLALGLLVMLLAGCQMMMTPTTATTGGDAVRVACGAFTTITYSSSGDEPETVAQIRSHNAAYLALCRIED